MRNYKRFLLALFILPLLFWSCDPDFRFMNCNNCKDYVPDEGKTIIKFTTNQGNPEVPFFIYKGEKTGQDTVIVDKAQSESESLFLETETDFSVEAIYQMDDKTVHVFDGGKIRVDEIECDETTCYQAKVLNLDLELKKN